MSMIPLRTPRKADRPYRWAAWADEQLLSLRFRDLRLRLRGSPLEADIARLHAELARRGILFKPHVWLSESWFSPDGVPGIAAPFFAAHPRLGRLEQRMVGEAEGASGNWRMQLLRHEAGHAFDTAFGLRRRADWRRVFGPASAPYPRTYVAKPASRAHVLHLGAWYAQSHPTEDFAETFAVWLGGRARWRRDYAGWPALEKLEYVDALMAELAGCTPRHRDRSVVAPLADDDRTLRAYYRRKQARYHSIEHRYDAALAAALTARGAGTATSKTLRSQAPTLRRALAAASLHPYLIEHALRILGRRARELDLVPRAGARAERRLVAVHKAFVRDLLARNQEQFVR